MCRPFKGLAGFTVLPRALPWAGLFAHLRCSRPVHAKVYDALRRGVAGSRRTLSAARLPYPSPPILPPVARSSRASRCRVIRSRLAQKAFHDLQRIPRGPAATHRTTAQSLRSHRERAAPAAARLRGYGRRSRSRRGVTICRLGPKRATRWRGAWLRPLRPCDRFDRAWRRR